MPTAKKAEKAEAAKMTFLEKIKAVTKKKEGTGKVDRLTFWGRTGFILSIVAILTGIAQVVFLPAAIFMTIPLAILGIVFSAIGLRAKKVGLAVSGLTISIVMVNLAFVIGLYVLIATMLSSSGI